MDPIVIVYMKVITEIKLLQISKSAKLDFKYFDIECNMLEAKHTWN